LLGRSQERGTIPFIRALESDIIRSVDVLITGEAALGLEALNVLRPGRAAWGVLVGHKRGHRYLIEHVFFAGAGTALPSLRAFDELDRLWDGRIVGLLAIRPDAAFKKLLLGPYFYGRLYLDLRPAKNGPRLRAYAVDFDRVFFLSPVRLERGPEGGGHERAPDA
jgi:hypothetical protein